MLIIRGTECLFIRANRTRTRSVILATKPRLTIHCPTSDACPSFTCNSYVAHLSVQAEHTWNPRKAASWELKPLRVVVLLYFGHFSINYFPNCCSQDKVRNGVTQAWTCSPSSSSSPETHYCLSTTTSVLFLIFCSRICVIAPILLPVWVLVCLI